MQKAHVRRKCRTCIPGRRPYGGRRNKGRRPRRDLRMARWAQGADSLRGMAQPIPPRRIRRPALPARRSRRARLPLALHRPAAMQEVRAHRLGRIRLARDGGGRMVESQARIDAFPYRDVQDSRDDASTGDGPERAPAKGLPRRIRRVGARKLVPSAQERIATDARGVTRTAHRNSESLFNRHRPQAQTAFPQAPPRTRWGTAGRNPSARSQRLRSPASGRTTSDRRG